MLIDWPVYSFFLSCSTVNVRPAMVNVPVRLLPPWTATLNRTVPLPLPVAPSVIVIHDSLLVAVQPQPAPAETATAIEPPFSLISCSVGLIE